MDFSISKRSQTILEMISDFVAKELVPMEEDFLRYPFRSLLPEIEKKRKMVKQMGLWAPGHPTELGGAGLGLGDRGLVSEAPPAISRSSTSMARPSRRTDG